MIKIYYRMGCGSSRRALAWFQTHRIEVRKQRVDKLTKEDLVKLLSLSDEGTSEVLKCASRSSSNVNKMLNHIMELTFNEALDFILEHPIMLQAPLILDEDKHLIGYNEDEIRMFLPKKYRRHNF
jgi:regulatory protein spx